MIHVRIHESYRKVIALCDSELLGKRFVEGKMQLEVRESFYKGEGMDEENAKRVLKKHHADDSTFNIVGSNSVRIAREAGIIFENNIGSVANIPFALVLL